MGKPIPIPVPLIDPQKRLLWQAPSKTAAFQSISINRQGFVEIGVLGDHRVYATVPEAEAFSQALTRCLYQIYANVTVGPVSRKAPALKPVPVEVQG